MPASLDGARASMQIDVGFGDLVDPPPAELAFPVLLPLKAHHIFIDNEIHRYHHAADPR